MTGFLASVKDIDEALLALEAGVDIIDLKDPGHGALGALTAQTIAQIVKNVHGRKLISATIGDLVMEPERIVFGCEHTAALGVDIVKVGFFGAVKHYECAKALQLLARREIKIVAVLFADQSPDFSLIPVFMEAGFYGVMLDTCNKDAGSLTEHMTRHQLKEFIRLAEHCGLESGLAGSLKISDIPALASLKPGYLGFRSGLCRNFQRTQQLERKNMKEVGIMLRESNIAHEISGWA